MKKLYFTAFLLYFCLSTYATVRNVPANYPTIQAALNVCTTGDTILVQPGTYFENISWTSVNGIKLLSAGDSSNTIIDGNQSGSVITFSFSVIDTNTVIRGFKITGGFKTGTAAAGGGILITDASPKFEEVAITGNHILAANWADGAGVNCNNSNTIFENSSITSNRIDSSSWGYGAGINMDGTGSPQFRNVRIENNFTRSNSWNYGVGVYCSGPNPVFENTIVKGNNAADSASWCYGTGMYFDNSMISLTNVIVSGNIAGKNASWYYGTGIFFSDCSASFTNVLVAGNLMGDGGNYYYGSGIYARVSSGQVNLSLMNVTVSENKRTNGAAINGSGLYADAGSVVTITNSIFWNMNSGTEISATGATANVTYSDIRGGFAGTGNLNLLPHFTSANDFHLTQISQCIDAGTLAGAPAYDLDNMPRPLPLGSNPDMGCYEIDQTVSIFAFEENKNQFHNYPNPFSTTTKFIFPDEILKQNSKLLIFDTNGKIVFNFQISQPYLELSREGLNNGIYFYQLIGEEKIIGSGKMLVE